MTRKKGFGNNHEDKVNKDKIFPATQNFHTRVVNVINMDIFLCLVDANTK